MEKNYHPIIYKGSYIKAYSGIYELYGSDELKQFAYDVGFGERNCQGFGMFEIYKEKKPVISEPRSKREENNEAKN